MIDKNGKLGESSRVWYPGRKETVMLELTDEQRQQLESGKAIDITDPRTAQRYVILQKEVYERVRHLLYDDSEWTEDELRLRLARSAQDNGWDEAGMEDYDRYDEKRRKRCP
jgi:hypothetical protein